MKKTIGRFDKLSEIIKLQVVQSGFQNTSVYHKDCACSTAPCCKAWGRVSQAEETVQTNAWRHRRDDDAGVDFLEPLGVMLSEPGHFLKHLLWPVEKQVASECSTLHPKIRKYCLNLSSSVTDCVTLGKSLPLCEPLFPHLFKWECGSYLVKLL